MLVKVLRALNFDIGEPFIDRVAKYFATICYQGFTLVAHRG